MFGSSGRRSTFFLGFFKYKYLSIDLVGMSEARLSPPCDSATHDASSESAAIELLRLKRKLAATRQELDQARDGRPKKIP